MKDITRKQLKENLDYNKKTGDLIWKISRPGVKKGTIAGTNNNGYINVRIFRKAYGAHRLIWLWMTGYLPKGIDIDHKDRIRYHNWWSNLRLSSRQCNIRNTGNRKNNTSGIKGVYWDKIIKKWGAYIIVNYKQKNLGKYLDFDNAVCARLAGEQCLGWSGCDDNSPAYQYVKEMLI